MSNHRYFAAFVALFSLAACKSGKQGGTAKTTSISVLSYNIHHANPPSKEKEGAIDMDAIARGDR